MVVVDVDPREFDGEDFSLLLERLKKHFMVPVSVITPDWQAEGGVRIAGDYAPLEVAVSPTLQWRELILAPNDHLPF